MKNDKHRLFGTAITRRDFLNGVALGSGLALLGASVPGQTKTAQSLPLLGDDWYGYGGVGDYQHSHGNTPQVVNMAHRLRDGGFAELDQPLDNMETYDLLIVGCGMAGLGGALEFLKRRKDGQSCLMLDNHPVFGGEAKENEFNIDGERLIAPQGANGFFVPQSVRNPESATGDPRYYAELGIPREFALREWPAARSPLRFSPDNYEYLVRGLQEKTSVGHYFPGGEAGTWAIDMFSQRLANSPLSTADRESLLKWYAAGATATFQTEADAVRVLDSVSYEDFLRSELGLGAAAARYSDLFLASAVGLGSDAVSAYMAYHLPMPGLSDPPPDGLRRNSFPGGNSGFVRHFVKRLVPQAIAGGDNFDEIITGRINFAALDRPGQPVRMRLASTALSVEHIGEPGSADRVRVIYSRDGKLSAVEAKAVIMATGGWINRHVVRDMPEAYHEAYRQFIHAPFLVANVALRNWRFLYKLGVTAAIWDRSEGGFGFTCNIRNPMQVGDYQPPLHPDEPAVLTFYTPFHRPGLSPREQVALGRAELLSTSYADYEHRIVRQMTALFGGSGFDPESDVAGLVLNRWGHAYSVPFPGFFGGAAGMAPRDTIRQRYGRVAFAHSELDGMQHWGPAADEGRRAFSQLASAL